jgi:hypothetical protein
MTYDPYDFAELMSDLLPTRPPLECPYCGRKGHLQRTDGFRVCVAHTCPGPWTLEKMEEVTPHQAPWRITVHHGDRRPLYPYFADWLEQAEGRTNAGR